MNEAEIRAQIVDVWLRDHGFTSDQILLEKTFNIQLGRGVYSLGTNTGAAVTDRHGRSDYLVRAGDGRNLFIVETKAAGEPIDDASRKQAISYARLLEDGGIAPFVILTNGRQTEIIDSISGVLVGGDSIPLTHPHGAAGFRISVDDFTCRAEALEHLISVSPENLLVFCRAQVRERMTRLRNDDLKSGFKYIPSLYVERERERERLLELISERQQCVLVLGPPQVGKTNFTCHFVEEQLSSGTPCLFYPAVGVELSLLDAIRQDFQWTFADSSSAFQVIRHKLGGVLKAVGKRLLIFVEGLNENEELIRTFSAESERFQKENICLIVSFTTDSAAKILLDAAGNPTYAATATGVQKRDVALLEISPSNVVSSLSAVHLGRFSNREMDLAYSGYSLAFNVAESENHQRTNEPLLLRNAMECFSGGVLPTTLDAAELLAATINEKLSRLTGLTQKAGRAIMEEVARRICDGQSVSDFWLYQTTACMDPFFEAGLLSRRGGKGSSRSIDFYVSSERSFVISHWVRNWPSVLANATPDIEAELRYVLDSDAATQALRWFFRQETQRELLRNLAEKLSTFQAPGLRKLIVLCLCEYLVHAADNSGVDDDRLSGVISDLHSDTQDEAGRSEVTDILRTMLVDPFEDLEIRRNSAIALGRFSPDVCVESFAAVSQQTAKFARERVAQALEPGFIEMVNEMIEHYYGSYCPGALNALDEPERRLAEYNHVIGTWLPVIKMFHFSTSAERLEDILRELNPEQKTVRDFSRQTELFKTEQLPPR